MTCLVVPLEVAVKVQFSPPALKHIFIKCLSEATLDYILGLLAGHANILTFCSLCLSKQAIIFFLYQHCVFYHIFFPLFNCVTPLWSLAWGCGAHISHRAPQRPKKEMLSDSSDPPSLYLCSYLGASLPLEVLLLNPSLLYCEKQKKTMRRAGNTGTVWTLVCVRSGYCSHIMKLEFCPVIGFPWLHKLRLYHLRPHCTRAY